MLLFLANQMALIFQLTNERLEADCGCVGTAAGQLPGSPVPGHWLEVTAGAAAAPACDQQLKLSAQLQQLPQAAQR